MANTGFEKALTAKPEFSGVSGHMVGETGANAGNGLGDVGAAWLPIESAPRDGHFLLWCSDLRTEWPDRVKKPVGVVMGHSFDGYLSGAGMNGNWTFTHWMPLPPAPTPQEARHEGEAI